MTEETIGVDVIADVVHGPGHYLGSTQTINVMETEYLYPELGDRSPPTQWEEYGSSDIWSRARGKVKELMQKYPVYITPEQDAEIRAKFELNLTPEDLTAKSGRWK